MIQMKRAFFTGFLALAMIAPTGISAQSMMGGPGGGMMGGGPGGAWGGGMMGGGMMGGWDYIPPGAQPMTLDRAVEQARKYLAAWGNDDLKLSEVMEFSNHFYVEVAEKSSGMKAFELLLNKYTGAVFNEPGPNMMWNQKYGMMTGAMMSGLYQPEQQSKMPITPAKARELAQKSLDAQRAGLKVEEGADAFYGYYTIHVLKDGKTFGMLGVNGYTGQVWYHTWHGRFVDMKELE